VTILLAYLVVSSIASCAFLWILLHRGGRVNHSGGQQDWNSA
jgi:hypothetical protein